MIELPEPNQVNESDQVPLPPSLIQQRPEIYPLRINRPNPLLEPSYNSKVMAKQLPRYEGLLNPQPIEIELRGRLPSYDVDKAIQKYPFSMDICHMLPTVLQPGDLKFKISSLALMCLLYVNVPWFPLFVSCA